MKYKQVTIITTHEEADLAAYAMIEAGSDGACVKDAEDIKEILRSEHNWDYYDDSLRNLPRHTYVTGCYDENADLSDLFSTLREFLGRDAEITVSVCDSADWENEWKKYYSPLDFGRFVVVPKWMDGNYDKPKILIDPGMAFGTGLHESTGMCLGLLSDMDCKGAEILDVGCGSGILGISALALGAKDCTFIDIDPQAANATQSNLSFNGLSAEVICGDLASDYKGCADIVLANLTADILIRLRTELPRVMKKGSVIIMSGIIDKRTEEIERAYFGSGLFEKKTEVRKNGWTAYAAVKR